jgi:cellulose synthase operon protein YhjU
MGLWSLYFAAKIYLYYKGFIRLDVLLNILFLIFLFIPIPKHFKFSRFLAVLKYSLSVILGILLLWHDSWLPAPLDAYRQLKENGMPSKEYIYGFLLRFYNLKEIIILAVIMSFCVLVRKYRKITAAGTVILLLLPLIISAGEAKHLSGEEIEKYAGSFYNSELTRLIHFKPPQGGNPGFDIIILHVCSFSWDDLHDLHMEGDPFIKQFDYLFTNFNSVTTYSNPSVIRLLNANCGQRRHGDLYNAAPKECSLMGSLHDQGYKLDFARNHDGKYGKFDEEVKKFGQFGATPFTPSKLVARKYMFDNSPVYDDYHVLEQWWRARQKSRSKNVALYYNTVSLHDGTHWSKDTDWWNKDEIAQYTASVQGFLGDMSKFFKLLASSGRNVLVVFVAEHGRSIHGSVIAPSGLRDIPLPRITTVPVGIKLFGKGYADAESGRALIISKPASYFALSYMLAAFTERSPFQADHYSSRNFIDSIPQTFYVSENQDNVIVKKDGDYYLFGKDKKWIFLTENELK